MNTSRWRIPWAVFLAGLFGIASGLLFINLYIPNILLAAWIAFGIAAAVLLILVALTILAIRHNEPTLKRCLCRYGAALLIATLATLVVTVMALSITLAVTTSIAVLFGILAALTAAMLLILLCLFRCIFAGFCNQPC